MRMDLARPLTTAGEELDDQDHDLSDLFGLSDLDHDLSDLSDLDLDLSFGGVQYSSNVHEIPTILG